MTILIDFPPAVSILMKLGKFCTYLDYKVRKKFFLFYFINLKFTISNALEEVKLNSSENIFFYIFASL